MSLIKLDKSFLESSTIITRHNVEYVSSSLGVTGSISVAARTSDSLSKPTSAEGNFATAPNEVETSATKRVGELFTGRRLNSHTVEKYVTASFYDYSSIIKSAPPGSVGFPQSGAYTIGTKTGNLDASKKLNIMSNREKAIKGASGIPDSNGVLQNEYKDTMAAGSAQTFKMNIGRGSINSLGSTSIVDKTMLKNYVIKTLIPQYKGRYNDCDFSYKNYNALNFFTASNQTQKEVLVYKSVYNNNPLKLGNNIVGAGTKLGFFTSFWINPRYTTDDPGGEFNPGTVLHVSSSLALTLLTGSSLDHEGYPNGYRIMLQLSHSADLPPSSFVVTASSNKVNDGLGQHDLIFVSDDNTLKRNQWHYVSAKLFRTSDTEGTVFLRVDDKVYTQSISSGSITSVLSTGTDKVFVGNHYDGTNTEIVKFFSRENSRINFSPTEASAGFHDIPSFNSRSTHPLNAEIHEVKVHAKYLDDKVEEDYRYTGVGISGIKGDGNSYDGTGTLNNHAALALQFYLPVFYDHVACRSFHASDGQILLSPFLKSAVITSVSSRTAAAPPFNKYFSNGVGGKYLNVFNFTRDFTHAKNNVASGGGRSWQETGINLNCRPIHFNMSASLANLGGTAFNMSGPSTIIDVDEFMNSQASVRKRNTLIISNDNGQFTPDYFVNRNNGMYLSDTIDVDDTGLTAYHENGLGNRSFETISMLHNVSASSNSIESDRAFPIRYLTQDATSNDITIFAISNLFYGERIHPGTFVIEDTAVTGTDGKVKIKLKDDGRGGLYRANCETAHATWNIVGNIFYDEGIVLIKSPHPPYFGKNGYSVKFKGEHSIHVTTVNVPCPQNMFNESSNKTHQIITASNSQEDKNNPFVYISDINIHDEDLNVIMKASLAQPVKKRESDSFMFRLKQDF